MDTKMTAKPSILNGQVVTVGRAVLYARVSTDEQAESGTSPEGQVEVGFAYAARSGLEVVRSGRTIPALYWIARS